jgi:hypothetical protein
VGERRAPEPPVIRPGGSGRTLQLRHVGFLVVRPTTGTASSSVRTSSAPVPCSAWRRAWAICCSVNRGFFSAILPSVEDRRHRHVLAERLQNLDRGIQIRTGDTEGQRVRVVGHRRNESLARAPGEDIYVELPMRDREL